jgi:hypothetical protein
VFAAFGIVFAAFGIVFAVLGIVFAVLGIVFAVLGIVFAALGCCVGVGCCIGFGGVFGGVFGGFGGGIDGGAVRDLIFFTKDANNPSFSCGAGAASGAIVVAAGAASVDDLLENKLFIKSVNPPPRLLRLPFL